MRKMEGHYINEIEDGHATVRMFGTLGQDINGHYLAQDLSYLGEQVSEIDLLINSEGGSVLQGLSVIAAIQNSPAVINARIVGVAASMAGVIAMACENRSMVDFGRLMIHDPAIAGKRKLTGKQKNAVENIKGILVAIYKKRSSLSEEEISKVMTDETWYNAQEALDKGFITSIESTEESAALLEANLEDVFAHANKKFNQNTVMENVLKLAVLAAAFEGISEDASEDQIVNFIQEKETKISDLEAQISTLTEEANKVEGLENTIKDLKNTIAENKVDAAISAGKISKEKRDSMIELELKNEGTIDAIIEAVPSVSANIEDGITGEAQGQDAWTFEDWSKNDPKGLEAMKNTNPSRFNRLFTAQYGESSSN